MSNDIKIVDYIPEDGILCSRCKFYEICPVDYVCPSVDRQLDFEYGEDIEG